MQKTYLIFIVLISLNFSCKNSGEEQVISQEKREATPSKQLSINFNFKTNQPDVFKIMMNNIEVDNLQKKNIQIFEDVIPSTNDDAIKADFDANNISNNIIIHLGNETVKEVEVKSILVAYGKNQLTITSAQDLNKYFAFNKFIKRDSTTKILETKRVDGKHNPSFRLRRNLINFLKKE